MLELFSTIFSVLTAWCPRFSKVPPTHRMIKWSNCGEATLHGPGKVWHWPLVTDQEILDIRFVSTLTSVQCVTMFDGTTVSARTMTRWRVSDVIKAMDINVDYADSVAESAQSVTVDVLGSLSREHLRTVSALNASLTMSVQEELERWGIEVEECKFTELCVSPAFRLINDAS